MRADGLTRTALPGVSVVCSPTTSEPLCGIAEPTLAVVAQGVKETTLNGRTFTYGAGQFLVVSVDLPVIGHVTHASADEPFLAFVLELRPQMIAALLLETATAASRRTGGPRRLARGHRRQRRITGAVGRDRPAARAARRAR